MIASRVGIALAVMLLCASHAAAADFTDNFDSGTLSAWQCTPCEDWSITCASTEGTALLIEPFAPSLLSTLCVTDQTWTDLQMDVDLRGLIPTDKMVRVRTAADGAFYYVNVRSAPANDVWLQRFVPGDSSSITLDTAPFPHDVGEWHHLMLKVIGNRLQVSVDGALLIDVTDPSPIPEGGVCLAGWTGGAAQCAVQWDNVTVTDLGISARQPATWGEVKGLYR